MSEGGPTFMTYSTSGDLHVFCSDPAFFFPPTVGFAGYAQGAAAFTSCAKARRISHRAGFRISRAGRGAGQAARQDAATSKAASEGGVWFWARGRPGACPRSFAVRLAPHAGSCAPKRGGRGLLKPAGELTQRKPVEDRAGQAPRCRSLPPLRLSALRGAETPLRRPHLWGCVH